MKNPNKQKAARAMWAAHPWKSPVSKEELTRLYWTEGKSQREIATQLGLSQKSVLGAMKRLGIQRRKAAKRLQAGAANTGWKGKSAGYQAKHTRIQRALGTPQKCEVCATTDTSKTYDWANLTGNYDDPKDYRRMCRSCHRRYDNARKRAP